MSNGSGDSGSDIFLKNVVSDGGGVFRCGFWAGGR